MYVHKSELNCAQHGPQCQYVKLNTKWLPLLHLLVFQRAQNVVSFFIFKANLATVSVNRR